jgi:hypothetical protein
MKRFTSEGTNDQEGRELLISAQTNGEEEASLGLSLEGVTGPRRYSRRQALGLLGGSLAGLTLLSPTKSHATEVPFRDRDHIALECMGHLPGNRWLDGRTQDGTVGLAPHTKPPFTGTRWQVVKQISRWSHI